MKVYVIARGCVVEHVTFQYAAAVDWIEEMLECANADYIVTEFPMNDNESMDCLSNVYRFYHSKGE